MSEVPLKAASFGFRAAQCIIAPVGRSGKGMRKNEIHGGFRVPGSGFRFRVQGSGFRVQGPGSRVLGERGP